MKLSNFRQKALVIFLLNLTGLIIFLSWYLPAQHGIWLSIDTHIFYFLISTCYLIVFLRLLLLISITESLI